MTNCLTMKKNLIFLFCCFCASLQAQPYQSPNFLYGYITETGDTMLVASLREVTVSAPLYFSKADDYKRYRLWKQYGKDVVGYAAEATRSWRELQAQTQDLNKKNSKKRTKELQEQLSLQFKDQLKKLNRSQGKILVKMIEKELHMPMYDILKELKGSFTAAYWNQFSKAWGYNLRDGYIHGEDNVMDAVLSDFDLSLYISK